MPRNKPGAPTLEWALFACGAFLLCLVSFVLIVSLWFQYTNYREAVTTTLARSDLTDHAAVLGYARAWDFAVVKTSALFLGFCLVFVGCLYVLRAGTTSYAISVEGEKTKGALETTSPGLVIITLGVVLVAIGLFKSTEIEYWPTLGQESFRIGSSGERLESPVTSGPVGGPTR